MDTNDNNTQTDSLALTGHDYAEIISEIDEQPRWRSIADKEMDYADGNQLDSELLRKQAELGIPPAIENLIGPSILSIQGYEATVRTDWRVTPDGQDDGQDVADAINHKLNQAERQSKADDAMGLAFRPQIACGIGWVEVSRESNPFKYPYRCTHIHRNEIHWDMKAMEPDLSDARWLRRQRWMGKDRIAKAFPQHKDLILQCGDHGPLWWQDTISGLDGGMSTGLQNAWHEARAWTMQEDRWYNRTTKELCLAEVWYRRWINVHVIKTPDGRVVEYDEGNPAHVAVVASGAITPIVATVPRVRRSYWLGPHCLHDGTSPYTHQHFPYVMFSGFVEDSTRVPFGYIRDMIYAQDAVNSGIAKQRWGMAAFRVERTKGAVAMSDEQFRRTVGRLDADIVLDAENMARQGSRFEVKRDFNLTEQQQTLVNDNRASIRRVSAVTDSFQGKGGTAKSGYQEAQQIEQSNQSLAYIMSRFRLARSQVGELLMAMIIEDMGINQQTVIIEGDAIKEDRTIVLNKPETDPDTGIAYLSNDIQRTRLKVALEDVPSTNSYRAQQLSAMTETVKSLPPQYQAAATPFMVSLMDTPFKREFVEAIRKVQEQESPEAMEKRIRAELSNDLKEREIAIKERDLAMREREMDSIIKNLDAKAVQAGVQSSYSAMQAGVQIAQMPMIAPIADAVMQGAGYKRPSPMGDDPNFPVADTTAAMNIKSPYIQGEAAAEAQAAPAVRQNTSPSFPPVPREGGTGMNGIETARTNDNLPVREQQ